jgi:hypothetical protein
MCCRDRSPYKGKHRASQKGKQNTWSRDRRISREPAALRHGCGPYTSMTLLAAPVTGLGAQGAQVLILKETNKTDSTTLKVAIKHNK